MAYSTNIFQMTWPLHNQWVANATFVCIAFEALEWRVASPCPTPWVVVVGMLRTNKVNAL